MTDAAGPPNAADILFDVQQGSQLLVALFDEQDVLRHANPAFRQAYHAEPDGRLDWAGLMRLNHAQGCGAFIETDDIEAWLMAVKSRRGKLHFRAFEADLCDGRWLWVTETVQPGGWMLSVASDITSLRQDNRALRQAHAKALAASQTDVLTALSNRRHGMQMLQDALAHGESWPLCVAVLDLDEFKKINDGLGHAAGDQILCDLARQLQASIRREDGCARIGGDEFLLVLPAAGVSQASAIVERLLTRVRHSRPLAEQPGQGYSLSAGLAEACWGETAQALLSRADAALYRAKQAGRDRVERAE
ncbi:MAG: diguanylate cyclase [Burkholderiaceae bacterium]